MISINFKFYRYYSRPSILYKTRTMSRYKEWGKEGDVLEIVDLIFDLSFLSLRQSSSSDDGDEIIYDY